MRDEHLKTELAVPSRGLLCDLVSGRYALAHLDHDLDVTYVLLPHRDKITT